MIFFLCGHLPTTKAPLKNRLSILNCINIYLAITWHIWRGVLNLAAHFYLHLHCLHPTINIHTHNHMQYAYDKRNNSKLQNKDSYNLGYKLHISYLNFDLNFVKRS